MIGFSRIDCIDRLITQGAVVGGLLASGQIEYRAGFCWVGKSDGCARLEILAPPMGVDIVAPHSVLIRARVANCCRLDILDQLPSNSAIQIVPVFR